jgi:hypothetical protein
MGTEKVQSNWKTKQNVIQPEEKPIWYQVHNRKMYQDKTLENPK